MSEDDGLRSFVDIEVPEPTGPASEPDVRRLIALPAAEVAALRAKAAAADRVRELVARRISGQRCISTDALARALDGDGS